MASSQSYVLAAHYECPPLVRAGGGVVNGDLHVKLVWPCKDGHVTNTLLFGDSLGPFARRLFEWMYEEGACEAADRDKDWINLGMLLHTGEETIAEWERLKGLVHEFQLTRTKAELFQAALDRKVLLAPLSTAQELSELSHLDARGYWDTLPHPSAEVDIRSPGPICRFSATQVERLGPPPQLGADTEKVLAASRVPAVEPPAETGGDRVDGGGADERQPPLAGVKVLDFMWALAGPTITRVMADYGAPSSSSSRSTAPMAPGRSGRSSETSRGPTTRVSTSTWLPASSVSPSISPTREPERSCSTSCAGPM